MRASRLLVGGALSSRQEFSSSTARRAINKICDSAQEAIKDMKGSTTVLVGGFGFSGVPSSLINALRDRPDLKDFTVVSNNAGMPGVGLGELAKDTRGWGLGLMR
jgi:3-oxoacid CoA-transferase